MDWRDVPGKNGSAFGLTGAIFNRMMFYVYIIKSSSNEVVFRFVFIGKISLAH